MSTIAATAPAGWYPDPYHPAQLRWWDGYGWTGYVSGWAPAPQRRSRAGWITVLIIGVIAALLAAVVVGGMPFLQWSIESRGSTAPTPDSIPAEVATTLSATVRIEAESCGRFCVYEGTGVAISPTEILTAEHVVEGVDTVSLVDRTGREMTGTVSRRDAQTDLAVVTTEPHGLSVVDIRTEVPPIGVDVWVIGASDWIDAPVTLGVVSDTGDDCRDGVQDVQTTADIDSGDSGGPLVDAQGSVVGINKSAPEHGGGGSATASSEVANFLQLDQSVFDDDGYLVTPQDRDDGYCRYID